MSPHRHSPRDQARAGFADFQRQHERDSLIETVRLWRQAAYALASEVSGNGRTPEAVAKVGELEQAKRRIERDAEALRERLGRNPGIPSLRWPGGPVAVIAAGLGEDAPDG